MLSWFRKVYLAYHNHGRLRFKLAAGLGELWCGDGSIPQGSPLSMVFIVALCVPWCRRLEARAVGQDVSPGERALLSTFEVVRKSMKLWDVSGDGRPWSVELDIRDLGGHLDFTGTLSWRVRDATHGGAAVGALPLGVSG